MARILIVGGGAREHALLLALRGAGPEARHEVIVAPGNAGTAALARNVDVAPNDIDGLVRLAREEQVELVVVGPEAPLTLGLVDALAEHGIAAFGPSKAAARLEGSKAFMKEFLFRHGIPTAPFAVFEDAAAAMAHARAAFAEGRPLVVKADGLCAGKGVVVAADAEEACAAIASMLVAGELGDAGRRVVLEERLGGDEASFHVVCDGTRAVALAPAQDHKRIFDGDRGPNTGGMGAYAPAPLVTPALSAEILRTVVTPTLEGMAREGMPFRGVLFVGLMIERGVARVLEFNVRFGDPETTVLVPLLDGDWFALLDGAARGTLAPESFATRPGVALAVVMASAGYPAKPRVGDRIEGLSSARPAGTFVLHAGTREQGGEIVTAGGRVLTVGSFGATFEAAREAAYRAVSVIHFEGEQHRSDIGHRYRAG